jgi:hypothetical protein
MDHEIPSAAEDPRKEAVLRGAAWVMRELLKVMFDYTHGPASSPAIEAELGNQLIAAGQKLQKYGGVVRAGKSLPLAGTGVGHAGSTTGKRN